MSAGHTGAHRPILLGLGLGAVAGLVVHGSASLRPFSQTLIHHVTAPLGQLFLSLLLMLVVPLVFSSLITGVAGIGEPWREAVARHLPGFLMEPFRPGPDVRLSTLGRLVVPVGAALAAARLREMSTGLAMEIHRR